MRLRDGRGCVSVAGIIYQRTFHMYCQGRLYLPALQCDSGGQLAAKFFLNKLGTLETYALLQTAVFLMTYNDIIVIFSISA